MQRTLLLIEPDSDLRLSLAELFQMMSWNVVGAANAAQGLATVQAQPPALVLAAIALPHFDAHDLLEGLRARPDTAAVPVLLMSSTDQVGMISRRTGVPAHYIVLKPFDVRHLLALAESAHGQGTARS